MARTYNAKGVHTSPAKAGKNNIKNPDSLPKDELGINGKLQAIREKGKPNIYKGQWTNEELAESLDEFFNFCTEIDLKPTQPLLRVWLSVTKQTLWEWRTKPEKYGEKSDLVVKAFDIMESYLQANVDQYPTGSIFLLKASHGLADTTTVNITSNGNSPEEVQEAISKLGLDK